MKLLVHFLFVLWLSGFGDSTSRTDTHSLEMYVTHNAIKAIAYLLPFTKENLRLLKKQKWTRIMEIVVKNNVDVITSFSTNGSTSFTPSLRIYSLRSCFFLVAITLHMPHQQSMALINYIISEFYRGDFARFRREIRQSQAFCRINYDFIAECIRGDFVFAGAEYVGYESSMDDEEIRWSIIYLLGHFREFRVDFGFEKEFVAAILKITRKFSHDFLEYLNEDDDEDAKEDRFTSTDVFMEHIAAA
jgi:hypothetical protein